MCDEEPDQNQEYCKYTIGRQSLRPGYAVIVQERCKGILGEWLRHEKKLPQRQTSSAS